MIHYTTNNDTAKKISYIYEQFGINNCNFILDLYDEKLLNIDPFDEKNLSEEIKYRILIECMKNPWYFLREIIRIPTGGGFVRMKFHRGNVALLWLLLHNINTFVMLPRQRYKTTTIMSLLTYYMYFGTKNTKIMLFGNQDSLLIRNISIVRDIRNTLPKYLLIQDDKYNKDNSTEIYYKELGNSLKKKAPGNSAEQADNIGRGESTQIQMYDEFCHIKYIKKQYESAVLAYAEVAKIAKENNSPYFKVMASTAPFLNKEEGKWSYNFLNSCADFSEEIFDMKISQIEAYIKNNSNNGFIQVNFMYYDTDVENGYYEKQCKELLYDKNSIDREVLNKAKDVTTEHPLGQDLVSGILEKIKQPIKTLTINKVYGLKLYVNPEEIDYNFSYLGGLDSSGNLNKDFSSLTIVDPRNGEVIGVMRSNALNNAHFAKTISKIMKDLFKGMVLIAERNNTGIAILDFIIDSNENLVNRIYHQTRKDDYIKYPGFVTNKSVRDLLYGDLLRITVDKFSNKMYDQHIIQEISTLRRTRNGKIDHEVGYHDDTLLSYLFCFWFMIYADNKKNYINESLIFKNIDNNNDLSKIETYVDYYKYKFKKNPQILKIQDNYEIKKNYLKENNDKIDNVFDMFKIDSNRKELDILVGKDNDIEFD